MDNETGTRKVVVGLLRNLADSIESGKISRYEFNHENLLERLSADGFHVDVRKTGEKITIIHGGY